MNTRLSLTMTFCGAAALLAGCAGPSKAGIENRQAAHARLDAFNAQLTYQQSYQSFQVGELDRALQEIAATIEAAPDRAEYHVMHGRILMEMHRLESAVDAFAQAEQLDPENAEAAYFTGIAYQRWSNDEAAYEAYTRAFDRDSNNVQYLLAGSESLVALDRLDEATEQIEAHLTHFENNAALHHLLAQIARMQGDHTRAAALYRRARLLRPDDPALAEELARAQFAAGEYGQCLHTVEALERTLKTARPDLMHLRARCLALTERTSDARNLYVELTKSKADDPEVWVELGMLSWEMGDYRRVAQCSVQGIALAPTRYEGYLLKGVNERHRGNFDQAASLFQQSIQRTQTEVLPYLLLGMTFEDSGQKQKALEAYRTAIRVEPSSTQAHTLFTRLEQGLAVTVVDESTDEGEE